jgi:hypothetical protein
VDECEDMSAISALRIGQSAEGRPFLRLTEVAKFGSVRRLQSSCSVSKELRKAALSETWMSR